MVVLGIDAHKRNHTVVAVDAAGRKLDERTTHDHRRSPGAAHLGRAVRRRPALGRRGLQAPVPPASNGTCSEPGQRIVRVPPKLIAHVRDSAP